MKTIIFSLLIVAVLISPKMVEAQRDGDGNTEETGLGSGHSPYDFQSNAEEKTLDLEREAPTEVPFDGGLSALLIAGVAYGAKKASQRAKNKKLQPMEK